MNKTQNIFAMLKIFRTHKIITATRLAEMLDVEPRTVYRYMKELRAAGYKFKTKTGLRGYTEYVDVDEPE